MSEKERPTDVHALSNVGIRERVPFQPLFDTEKTYRNSARSVFNRTTDKDLVPKQTDETEEGIESG